MKGYSNHLAAGAALAIAVNLGISSPTCLKLLRDAAGYWGDFRTDAVKAKEYGVTDRHVRRCRAELVRVRLLVSHRVQQNGTIPNDRAEFPSKHGTTCAYFRWSLHGGSPYKREQAAPAPRRTVRPDQPQLASQEARLRAIVARDVATMAPYAAQPAPVLATQRENIEGAAFVLAMLDQEKRGPPE